MKRDEVAHAVLLSPLQRRAIIPRVRAGVRMCDNSYGLASSQTAALSGHVGHLHNVDHDHVFELGHHHVDIPIND